MTPLQGGTAPAATTLSMSESTFTLRDGCELFYRAWLPPGSARKALLLFHRGHEHSGRWQETVETLGLEDLAVFAWDARGHGRSSGDRGGARDLGTIVRDVDEFVRHVSERHRIDLEDMVVLGHSVGAVMVAAWVHDHAPPIRGMVLATPAFRVKLYVPFAVPLLRLRQKLLGPGWVKSYVKAGMLTHDPEEAKRYRSDPAIFRQIAVNILLDLHDASTRLLADAGAIHIPTLLLTAGSDWVVRVPAQARFFQGLSSPRKRMVLLPGFFHAVFHEKERRRAVEEVQSFVRELFERPPPRVSLLDADARGYTREEHDRLSAPGGFRFLPARLLLRSLGRMSRGLRLGWETGFDSGATLDYVYENRPQGRGFLGRAIDRAYLQSIGWRGIRERKRLLEAALEDAIRRVHSQGRAVRVLDIASGPGRYVLSTAARLRPIPVEVLLRDANGDNLETARKLAAELGLAAVTASRGDAFDRASLAAVRPRPTIAVVSGLYELFPENGPVLESLGGLAEALEPDGLLIYTNQPWHPQLEFIARVLPNREGKPWVMRRRTQPEMDELVSVAGFRKLSQEVDPWGMFTVSVARLFAP